MLSVENVYFGYDRRSILNNVSLSIDHGEIVCLLGPNGSGKTTLLKILMGLFRPHQGKVLLEGRSLADIAPHQLARRIAYVPQIHRQAFAYQVIDVVLMGRLPHKSFFFRYSPEDIKTAESALEELGILDLKNRSYTEISGGERQLTLIARAMAQQADIFVMDEPVSGLDYGNQIRLLRQIERLAGRGYTFIKTTHFPDHALWISNRVVMLNSGSIIADGPTASVVTEPNLYRLYKANIHVVNMNNGLQVCMPELAGLSEPTGRSFMYNYSA